jgi:hypothetical protein
VLADREGVEASVLGQDLYGAAEVEIVEVVGHVDTWRGTPSAGDVTLTPARIESARRAVE